MNDHVINPVKERHGDLDLGIGQAVATPDPPRQALDGVVGHARAAGDAVAKALAGNLVPVLLVGNAQSVVTALGRHPQGRFAFHTATDPWEALRIIDATPGIGVVVSDVEMSSMNGASLLKQIGERSPTTVRVLLTGHDDIDAVVSAVNDGHIYRLLTQPCDVEKLVQCVQEAATQHRLLTAERELQEKMLRGSVRALLDTLSMASPMAFARTDRIRRHVVELATWLGADDLWGIETGSMLAQLGTASLSVDVVERLHRGHPLSDVQQAEVDQLPEIAVKTLAAIPRLEGITRAIRLQRQRFDGRGPVAKNLAGQDIPLSSRLLAVATAFDPLEARGTAHDVALAALSEDRGRFDPEVLEALKASLLQGEAQRHIAALPVERLTLGMILAADAMTHDDLLLYGRGHELTEGALERLRHWPGGVCEPVAVYRQQSHADHPQETVGV